MTKITDKAKDIHAFGLRGKLGTEEGQEEHPIFGIYQRRHSRLGTSTAKMKFYSPVPPKTPLQLGSWLVLYEANQAWHELTEEEKEIYNERAKSRPLTGYNLFIREYRKENPPMPLYWSDLEESEESEKTIEERIAEVRNWDGFFLEPKLANLAGATPAAFSQVDGTYQDYDLLTFVDGATKDAYWRGRVPITYNDGNFYITIFYLIGNTASANIRDAILWQAYSTGEALDVAFGGLPAATRAYGAAGLVNGRIWIATYEVSTSKPTAGEFLQFCYRRLGGHAEDTVNENVRILGIYLAFPCYTT